MTEHPFTVSEIRSRLFLLKDHLVSGGTKRRGLDLLLKTITDDKLCYAGTIMGHGALALAHAAQDAGKQAHIFISGSKDNPMVQKLGLTNAVLHLHPPLPVSTLHDLARQHGGTTLPPGFDFPDFEECLVKATSRLNVDDYAEIWTTSVTGTLSRALRRAFPKKRFRTISVVKSGRPADYTAPEKYHQPARMPPPYPSCPYTDSKLWQFAVEHAAPDSLLWNTAG